MSTPEVRSAPIRRKPSAIIRTSTLDATRAHVERGAGIALILCSTAGCVAAVHGGLLRLLAAPVLAFILAGVCIQAACTFVEFIYRSRPASLPFLFFVGVDVATSLIGFGPIFVALLIPRIVGPIGTLATPGAWGIIFACALLMAWLPMAMLID